MSTDRQGVVTIRCIGLAGLGAHAVEVKRLVWLRTVASVAAVCALTLAAVSAVAAVPGTGCNVFPANNAWNTDISTLPVNANSAAWMASTGAAARNLHPDFGPSGDPSVPYGIPFTVVDSSHPKVKVSFQYAGESDAGPYPLGPDTPIEGGASSSGDRHAVMVDKGNCTLYELYDTHYRAGGSTAGSGAVFNLGGNGLRPSGWTSADAAGLPIFPGLLRLDEVNSGVVNHAIRFTVQRSAASFLWPARHQAGSGPASVNPPMGARFRMKAGVDIARFSPKAQVILRAFQHYGLIVADNGSNWFFQGDANNAWPDSLIGELKRVPAGDFEAVDESSLMVDPNSAQVRRPAGGGGGTPPLPAPRTGAASPVLAPAVAASTETAQGPPPQAAGAAAPGEAGAIAPTAAAASLPRRAGTVAHAALRVPPAPAQPPRWYWLGIVPATLALLVAALAWRRRGRSVGTD